MIGVPHPKWAERPLACVVVRPGRGAHQGGGPRLPRGQGGQVVAARRRRLHRRDPQDQRRQVLQEGPARQVRGLRAAHRLTRRRYPGSVSWRFVLRPKWIVRHVAVVLLVVVTMVLLGLWQLRRLDEKRDYKATASRPGRRSRRPTSRTVVPAGAAVGDAAVDAVALPDRSRPRAPTRTTTRSSWRTAPSTAPPGRGCSRRCASPTGPRCVVNRGFIGFDREGAIVPPPAPDGRGDRRRASCSPSQERGRFGPTDPTRATLDVLARVDLARFAAQVDYDVLPAYVQLVDSTPDEAAVRRASPRWCPSGRPEPERGPAPVVRGAVVHLHHDRGRRATCCCCGGWRGIRRRRRPAPPPIRSAGRQRAAGRVRER